MIRIMAVWSYADGPRLVEEWIRPGDVKRITPDPDGHARTRVTIAGRGILFSPEPLHAIVARVNGARRAPHSQPRIAR